LARDTSGNAYRQIYDVYNETRERMKPVFVTTDACYHTFHTLFDKVLQTIEIREFVDTLDLMLKTMLNEVMQYYDTTSGELIEEATLMSVAHFCVAAKLLDSTVSIPSYADSLVTAELELIDGHTGYHGSPIFGYFEDYSQYKVRGHYTLSDTLQRYFRSMMWLGRMTFQDSSDTVAALSALTILKAFENHDLMSGWEKIYLPTVFFVGKTDDINIYQYKKIAENVYGSGFSSLPIDSIANTDLLSEFMSVVGALPGPLITTFTPRGFRFMGQRFVPGSYIFTHTVNATDRTMPRALDVMSVIGSDRATEILRDTYSEPLWLFDSLDTLRAEFVSMPDSCWTQTLFWNWLYSLMPFLYEKTDGFPPFMQNPAWTDKELSTSLGSWTELRHNTILYAKQSVSPIGNAWWAPVVYGYVEPNPYAYARLASLTEFMRTGLDNLGLLYSDFEWRILLLKELLLVLKGIAEKELTNQVITADDQWYIHNSGDIVLDVVSTSLMDEATPGNGGAVIEHDSTDNMAVIADVHTDPNTGHCLEEGVGYPLEVYVIVKLDTLYVTRGALLSYYEFTQPFSNRLTDEEWREMLVSDSVPVPPVWTQSFIDPEEDFSTSSALPYWNDGGGYGVEEKTTLSSYLFVRPTISSDGIKVLYFLPKNCSGEIVIYDAAGRMISDLPAQGGLHKITIGQGFPSGTYFVSLNLGGKSVVRKSVLIR
jgi:hypothetical protein